MANTRKIPDVEVKKGDIVQTNRYYNKRNGNAVVSDFAVVKHVVLHEPGAGFIKASATNNQPYESIYLLHIGSIRPNGDVSVAGKYDSTETVGIPIEGTTERAALPAVTPLIVGNWKPRIVGRVVQFKVNEDKLPPELLPVLKERRSRIF